MTSARRFAAIDLGASGGRVMTGRWDGERFALEALPPDEAGAYHTIGGFCMARLGRVPKTADAFDWGGLHFEVIDMDGRRIDKVLVVKKPGAAAPSPTDAVGR